MMPYYRPIPQTGPVRPADALPLGGGWCWFDAVELIQRDAPAKVIPAHDLPQDVAQRLSAPRAAIAGMNWDSPKLMGILNVTPDSFSDGGLHNDHDAAVTHALHMSTQGANIIDIGGESTRPGAAEVSAAEEIERTAPVIRALRALKDIPISIDTRKERVARSASESGATLVNDVAGFTFDPDLAPFCVRAGLPVCVMHAQGTPDIMQQDPRYDNVALDVYDYLEARVTALVALGIPSDAIIVDPGIGFGKTLEHNLTLLQNLALFHGLGCPILLGASRKRFIGTIGGTRDAGSRVSGSLAVTLAGVTQGIQLHRVHDVVETAEALKLWRAATGNA